MRIITGLSIAALAMTAASAPAFGKAHSQPADPAQEFGQDVAFNSFDVRLDAARWWTALMAAKKALTGSWSRRRNMSAVPTSSPSLLAHANDDCSRAATPPLSFWRPVSRTKGPLASQ
jgi:hypothetical protein